MRRTQKAKLSAAQSLLLQLLTNFDGFENWSDGPKQLLTTLDAVTGSQVATHILVQELFGGCLARTGPKCTSSVILMLEDQRAKQAWIDGLKALDDDVVGVRLPIQSRSAQLDENILTVEFDTSEDSDEGMPAGVVEISLYEQDECSYD